MQNNLSTERFQQACAAYLDAGEPDANVEALQWAWGYLHSDMGGDIKAMGAAIGYDHLVLYKAFRGNYEASIANVCAAIRAFKKRAIREVGFIVTPVTQRIFEALDYCRDYRSLVTITGETGRSKTTSVRQWQTENNHGKSVYMRCTSETSRSAFVRTLAKAVGIGVSHTKRAQIEDRLFSVFQRKTLIIDEAGHLLPKGRGGGLSAIEFARDLHDVCECGVALVMTDVYLQQLRHGSQSAFFEQFLGRIGYAVDIPRKIYREEVQAFCEAFVGGKPDKELVDTAIAIAKMEGKLRTLADDMAKAKQFAQAREQELGSMHLKAARKWRMAGGSWTDLTEA